MNRINPIPSEGLRSIEARPSGATSKAAPSSTAPFAELLRDQLSSAVRFSRHALERLEARQIQLSAEDKTRLSQGIDRAASKGAQDSLLLLRDLAFIVNVQKRTVVTAVTDERAQEGVFTNIDSAVLL